MKIHNGLLGKQEKLVPGFHITTSHGVWKINFHEYFFLNLAIFSVTSPSLFRKISKNFTGTVSNFLMPPLSAEHILAQEKGTFTNH